MLAERILSARSNGTGAKLTSPLIARLLRMVRFVVVAASGMVVNTAALIAAVELGFHYLAGVILATQASTVWNFLWSEKWVFESGNRQWGARARFAQFWTLNNSFLLARAPLVWVFTEWANLHFVISNLGSLVAMFLVRYALAERFIWAPVTIAAQTRLEVAPQRVGSPDALRTLPVEGLRVEEPPAPEATDSPQLDTPDPSMTRKQLMMSGGVIGLVALGLRTVFLMDLGFNSDEAVYAGQAASIAGDSTYLPYFPIFRAHPLLFQTILSIPYQSGVSPLIGRLFSVAFGLATVWVIYLAGATLYSRRVGAIAALFLAVMPYHIVVTRQVLLDGPMTFFSTLSLLLIAKFGVTKQMAWFYAAFGAMGLTFLSKETGILLFGAIYAFVAIFGQVKIRNVVVASMVFIAVVLPYPISISFSGRSSTGEQFLAWQLLRRANHPWTFYPVAVPPAMGWLLLATAIVTFFYIQRRWGWQETVLASWIFVPVVFFQLWPVKGFQYLLPVAPPVILFASRGLSALWDSSISWRGGNVAPRLAKVAVVVVALSMAIPAWSRVQPASGSTEFLAGSGGVPGGREAGEWIEENVPEGANLLALGPSMANIVQFYGHRKAYGLSVSPNPLHRNPVYEPVNNPDLRIRSNDIQYIVWDSFSASRSEFFSTSLLRYVERYHGREVHTEFVSVRTEDGETVDKPVIIIYELRP